VSPLNLEIDMQPSEFIPRFADSFAAKSVYSEPHTEDGITIITAAAVRGGGGMGQHAADHEAGGGLGLSARPVGAYVARNGRVVWKPAFDLSRVVLRGQLVLLTAVLVAGFVLSRRLSAPPR
jgi:hypothetical protein